MGKALKTAGAIIGGAVLMATGVGALAGMQVTAMGIAGVGTMSVANLQLMSAGLMAAGSMLDKPKSTASGSPSDWTSNPDQGIPFLFGRMGVAGKIVHRDEYGPDNRLQGIVTIYSGAGPVKSFQGFTADELPVSFVSNGGTAVGKYSRQMWRSWRMGAQPDTALTLPTGLDGGAVMPMWGALYKLSGKACDLLTLQQDSKFSVYPSGEPQPMQVLEGVYGYDPRYDDTYPGGAGPCRYGVRSTYRYIDNAIIAALNWALGMIENGQVVGGIGASLQGVDLPAFIEAANIADANAWTVAAWPDTSEDASVVLDELLEAGGAKRSRVAGKISCVSRGAPRPSIVTITRRDTAGAIELDTGASRFNRLNTITPVIMSEAHKWKHAPMDPVSFAPLVTEDGGKRSDQIKYRFVSQVKQGAELAAYDILDAREPFSGTIPLLPHLRRLKPGDCFDIDEPGFMLDGVKMLVLSRAYDPKAGEVRIAFRSETDSKHPLALGKTTTMPAYPGLTAPDPTEVSPPQPGDWTIIPRPPSPGGGQLPVIDLSGIVSNATADAMLINWREVVEGEDPTARPPFMDEEGDLLPGWVDAGVWPPTTRTLSIQGPQPGAQIWIAIRYKRGNNVSPAELAGPVTVSDLIAGDTTHLKGEPVQDVLDRLTDTATLADQTSTEVQSIREMYGDTADAATSAAKSAAHEAGANQAKAEAILAAEASDRRAEAADAAKLEAQQARAGAVSARNDSVAAAGASGDAAAIAAEERRLATEARGQAQAEAQAAVGARNQASSFADAAGVGAAASQEASLKATAAAITTIPDAIAADLWTDLGTSGAPADRPSLAPARVVGGAFVAPTGGAQSSGPKQRVRWVQGKVIEIRLRAEVPAGTPAASVRIGVARFDANHASLNYGSWMAITPVASGGSAEVVYRVGCGVSVPGGSTINAAPNLEWLSLGCTPNLNAAATAGMPGAQMRITAFSVRDITEEVNAARSADASASSAASAAASDGAAGQKAAAAQRDMLAAQTARGGAESAEIRAVAARDDAQGHASTAASQAGLSAQYRDQSQTAAQASNEAAGIATTKADQAGASAQAANADKLAAQAARDTADQKAQASVTAAARAEAFAGDAGDWAAAAEGHALQAAARAGEGLAYRNAAVDARDEAVAARQGAGVSASTAQVAKVSTFPTRLDTDGSNFTTGANMPVGTVTPLPASRYENVAGFGLVGTASDGGAIYHSAPKDFRAGRVYRTRVRVEVVGPTAQNVRPLVRCLTGAFETATTIFGHLVSVPPGVVTELTLLYGDPAPAGGSAAPASTIWTRAGTQSGGTISGGKLRVYEIHHEDVTESVSAANSAASALTQSAIATAAASSAEINASLAASVSSRSGNLLSNTDFTTTAGWTANVPLNINGGPSGYHPLGERVLTVNHATAQVDVYSSRVSVEAGKWYEVSAYLLAHRSQVKLFIRWVNAAGGYISSPETVWTTAGGGGNSTLADYTRLWLKAKAPVGAVAAVLMARKSTTQSGSDSWMWMARPMLAETSETATGPALYTVGSGKEEALGLGASLSIVGAVAADAADRLASVRFDVTGGADGAPFQIWGRAGPAGSMAGMVASELALSNVVNGMVVPALKLIGGDAHFGGRIHAGAGKEIIIDPTLPAIITTMGNARMAEGKLPNDNLIYWFGPKQEVANMRKSNATEWRDASGQAYFAGGISAGQLQSSGRTSDQSASVSAQTGVFGSLGKTITVNVTYTAENRIESTSYTPPFPPSSDTTTPGLSAQIRLYRSLGGGPFELVSTFTATGSSRVQVINYGDFSEEISSLICGGSSTYVDPALSTQTRQYRVEMSNRNFNWLIGNTQQKSQMLSVVCVEG